jgi:hypothetical protein
MGMLQANLGSGWREISRTFRSEAISAAMYELTVWVRDPHTTSGTGSHARIDRVELNYAATIVVCLARASPELRRSSL